MAMLIWLENRIRTSLKLCVRGQLTESHLIAREEECAVRIKELRQASGAAAAMAI